MQHQLTPSRGISRWDAIPAPDGYEIGSKTHQINGIDRYNGLLNTPATRSSTMAVSEGIVDEYN